MAALGCMQPNLCSSEVTCVHSGKEWLRAAVHGLQSYR